MKNKTNKKITVKKKKWGTPVNLRDSKVEGLGFFFWVGYILSAVAGCFSRIPHLESWERMSLNGGGHKK